MREPLHAIGPELVSHLGLVLAVAGALADASSWDPAPGPLTAEDGALIAATTEDDVPAMLRALAAGARFDAVDDRWRTPILLASSEAALRVLKDAGADVDAVVNGFGVTPLQWAAMEGREPRIRALLAAGARLEVRDGAGRTALHYAETDEEVAALLLRAGADPDAFDIDGRTPLMEACAYGERRLAELLLDAGASPAMRDGAGESALSMALEHVRGDECPSNGGICRRLLERGADPGDVWRDELRRELAGAIDARDLAGVRRLLDAGAPPNPARGDSGLEAAVEKGDPGLVRMLLDAGADPMRGGCPLVRAIWDDRSEIVDLLIERMPDARVGCGGFNFSTTPLAAAARGGKLDLVVRLLEMGADPNAGSLPSALCSAAIQGHVEVVAALLDAGAEIDQPNHPGGCIAVLPGATALAWAARVGQEEVVALLLARGASLEAVLDDGPMGGGVTALEAVRALLEDCRTRHLAADPRRSYDGAGRLVREGACEEGAGERIEAMLLAAPNPAR